MSQGAFNLDSRSVLVDKLGEDPKKFQLSCLYFKNTRGLNAIYEIRRLKAELLDFAKDPNLKNQQLDSLRPRQPKLEGLSPEEQREEEENYRESLAAHEMAKKALKMQVPVEDYFAIMQYMEPYEDTIDATPAVKGRRFHALTKQIEEQQGGLFGFGKGPKQMG